MLAVYIDGRERTWNFENLIEVEQQRILFTSFYHLKSRDLERSFLFHSTLIDSQELVRYLRDRIAFSSRENEEK